MMSHKSVVFIVFLVAIVSVVGLIIRSQGTIHTIKPEYGEVNAYESKIITGRLENVNRNCIRDLKCSVTVAGVEIHTSPGYVGQDTIQKFDINEGSGDISGVEKLLDAGKMKKVGDLNYKPTKPITAEAYVRVHDDFYSVYGSDKYYIKVQ